MDFRFDDDERSLLAQAGLSFRKALPVSRLADGLEAGDGWRTMGDEGWLHAGLPEALGGGGLTSVMVAGIGREAGRTLAGDGFVDNAVVLPGAVVAAGGLPDALLTAPGFLVAGDRAGRAYGVEAGLSAYQLVDNELRRWAPGSWKFQQDGGLGVTSGTVELSSEPDEVVGPAGAVTDLLATARTVHAATLIGIGEAALGATIEHVKVRDQFGGPIGRFQAIKHLLADVTVGLEVAWNAVLYAALRPANETVPIAHLQASRAADLSIRTMMQLFGGIAMTWEHPSHWFVKVATTSRTRFGSTSDHALELADLFTVGSDS